MENEKDEKEIAQTLSSRKIDPGLVYDCAAAYEMHRRARRREEAAPMAPSQSGEGEVRSRPIQTLPRAQQQMEAAAERALVPVMTITAVRLSSHTHLPPGTAPLCAS